MVKRVTDQLGRSFEFTFPPRRIVSLVPSQTELLFDLGLDEEVVGLTKFCIHPIDKFAARTKVGGTKKLKIDVIRELNPDLIIGNKEENSKADIECLMEEFPVWMSDIYTLEDAMQTISQIGELVDRAPEANYLNHLISSGFNDLQTLALSRQMDKTVAYLIWKSPYLFAGRNTFIDDVLTRIGLRNSIHELRYPEVALEALRERGVELVFLSSEPYPFKDNHLDEIQAQLPEAKVLLVDGEMFSWYGSRLVKAVGYLFELQKTVIGK